MLELHKKTDVLIIDEISMMSPEFLEYADKVLRANRNFPDLCMGGIQVIFVGDFGQLPPVTTDSRRIFESKLWGEMIRPHQIIELVEPMRQTNRSFFDLLCRCRVGKMTKADHELMRSRIDAKLPELEGIEPTRLFPTNRAADSLNYRELQKLDESKGIASYTLRKGFFNSRRQLNRASTDKERTKLQRELTKLVENAPVRDGLELRVGAQVMLTWNMDVDAGLANGTRGVVIALNNKYLDREEELDDDDLADLMGDDEFGLMAKLKPKSKPKLEPTPMESEDETAEPFDHEPQNESNFNVLSRQAMYPKERLPVVRFMLPDGSHVDRLVPYVQWNREVDSVGSVFVWGMPL